MGEGKGGGHAEYGFASMLRGGGVCVLGDGCMQECIGSDIDTLTASSLPAVWGPSNNCDGEVATADAASSQELCPMGTRGCTLRCIAGRVIWGRIFTTPTPTHSPQGLPPVGADNRVVRTFGGQSVGGGGGGRGSEDSRPLQPRGDRVVCWASHLLHRLSGACPCSR
jgi:hypothetical protein